MASGSRHRIAAVHNVVAAPTRRDGMVVPGIAATARSSCGPYPIQPQQREDEMQVDAPEGFTNPATDRLTLALPQRGDLAELHELYADPQVWRDDPVSRHFSRDQTQSMIDRWQAGWLHNGLGMWVARGTEPATRGQLVGIGGCFIRHGVAWNLGFRLSPIFWGQGYAQEIIRVAVGAAREARADLPMTAYLLEGNTRSQRTTERAGLRPVWRGPDAGNPDPQAVRLLYADQDLSPALIKALTDD
jgi:RimJ/RimL family protein N-acetyltransferase